MSTATNNTRKQVRAGTTNRTDRSAWADKLRLIQNGLESLACHTQRDHYHHAVLYSAEPVPRDPRLYASGHRVARRIDISLPGGGHLTHFLFDHNPDAAEDGVIAGFQRELGRVRSVLRAMPRKLVPEFDSPPLDSSPDGHLVAWLSLLHWLAHQRLSRAFKAHLEWLPSTDSVAAGDPFVPWYECPGEDDADPVPSLTLTVPHENGVRIPEAGVVASSLSKPLLYASVNAIELLLGLSAPEPSGALRKKRNTPSGQLDDLSEQLLLYLLHHQKRADGTFCSDPLNQKEIAAELDCKQPKVSRRMKILFGDRPRGIGPMAYYRHLCREDDRIAAALSRLVVKYLDPTLGRLFKLKDPNQVADDEED